MKRTVPVHNNKKDSAFSMQTYCQIEAFARGKEHFGSKSRSGRFGLIHHPSNCVPIY